MSVEYKGLISPIDGEIKYFSERGIPLITQWFEDESEDIKPILTMENYMKWYSMYIIYPDGKVESISRSSENEDASVTWYDHAVYPEYFHLSAKRLGCTYDNRTFAMVCERFVEDVLDGDWTALHEYLPKK